MGAGRAEDGRSRRNGPAEPPPRRAGLRPGVRLPGRSERGRPDAVRRLAPTGVGGLSEGRQCGPLDGPRPCEHVHRALSVGTRGPREGAPQARRQRGVGRLAPPGRRLLYNVDLRQRSHRPESRAGRRDGPELLGGLALQPTRRGSSTAPGDRGRGGALGDRRTDGPEPARVAVVLGRGLARPVSGDMGLRDRPRDARPAPLGRGPPKARELARADGPPVAPGFSGRQASLLLRQSSRRPRAVPRRTGGHPVGPVLVVVCPDAAGPARLGPRGLEAEPPRARAAPRTLPRDGPIARPAH